jgi:hypothetical protein
VRLKGERRLLPFVARHTRETTVMIAKPFLLDFNCNRDETQNYSRALFAPNSRRDSRLLPKASTYFYDFKSKNRCLFRIPHLFLHKVTLAFHQLMRSKRNARLAKTDDKAFFTKFKSLHEITKRNANFEVRSSFHTETNRMS